MCLINGFSVTLKLYKLYYIHFYIRNSEFFKFILGKWLLFDDFVIMTTEFIYEYYLLCL